jgi:hypothetical protein
MKKSMFRTGLIGHLTSLEEKHNQNYVHFLAEIKSLKILNNFYSKFSFEQNFKRLMVFSPKGERGGVYTGQI